MAAVGAAVEKACLIGGIPWVSSEPPGYCPCTATSSPETSFHVPTGEEGFDGAELMIDESVLKAAGRPVDTAFGLHVTASNMPHSRCGSKRGLVMAAHVLRALHEGILRRSRLPVTGCSPLLVSRSKPGW